MTLARPAYAIVALGLLTALSGCGGGSGFTAEDRAGRMLIAPGKYMLYGCDEIAQAAVISAARAEVLEQMMAKASVDAGGRFVSGVAYEPEYVERRGELNELRNAAREKNCKPIPALNPPAPRTSDGVVR